MPPIYTPAPCVYDDIWQTNAPGGMPTAARATLLRTMKNSDAMKMFRFSIIYLMAIFPIMLLDHYLLPKPLFS